MTNPVAPGDAYAPFGKLIKMLHPRAGSIAIYGVDGEAVWYSDGVENTDLHELATSIFGDDKGPSGSVGQGLQRRTVRGDRAVVLPLVADSEGPLLGALAVELDVSGQSESMIASLFGPVLACIARQLKLEGDAAGASERATGGDDLELLLGNAAGVGEGDALEQLVQKCVDHLDGVLGALVIPDKSLTICCAPAGQQLAAADTVLTRTHRHLLAWAQLNDRPMVVNRVARGTKIDAPPFKILSCPIRDVNNRVAGILGLFRRPESPDFEVRDVRILELMARKVITILGSDYDSLTGLLNRPAFERQTQAILDQNDENHSLLYVDIDKLHLINDSFGFHAGDEVIRRFADILREQLSGCDIAGRIAGDRFAVLLPQRDLAVAQSLSEELCKALAALRYLKGDKSLPMSMSVGVAQLSSGGEHLAHGLAAAEVACKAAKDRGRNRVEVFKDDDASIIKRHNDIFVFASLQDALRNNTFCLDAQPIVRLGNPERITGLEVLVRMLGENGEKVAPDKFLSAAERYQLMPALDRWVVSSTLEQVAAYHDVLAAGRLSVSINISGQSITSESFVSVLLQQLMEGNVAPELLVFELTETAAVADLEQAEDFIRKVQDLGCRVALDDFGSGLSSFAFLKNLPVDYLKIDGSFVRDVATDRISESMVVAINQVARVMGLETVAEYVENAEIVEKLASLGVDFGQGFHLGRPEPLDQRLAALAGADELRGRRSESTTAA
jgi:diguanylate cyclase (GGDEF)-like protein